MVLIYKEDDEIDPKELQAQLDIMQDVDNRQEQLEPESDEAEEKIKEITNKGEESQFESDIQILVGDSPAGDEKGEQLLRSWLNKQYGDENNIVKEISSMLKINFTDAQKHIPSYPDEPIVSGKNLPNLVKEMKMLRRKLKGDNRDKITKAIGHLINAYQEHIQKCIDSIYWVSPYETTLKTMSIKPDTLKKLYYIKDRDTRMEIIDSLCKVWENDLERKGLDFGDDYHNLTKEIKGGKKEFKNIIKNIAHQSIRKTKSEYVLDNVVDIVIKSPGITANQIHNRLPKKYHKVTSPHSIAKMLKRVNATNVKGEYCILSDEIKKDLYSYIAGFIDSDGYITMDAQTSPRVGMIATGNRGKAFFEELSKEMKIGRLHLDQKVGENSRSQHRLNFYSQGDILELLEKCMPHLRMKQKQAELLMEAIRIKKGYKKQEWSKPRLQEIFKLMKYENWKDSKGQGGREFEKYGIDPEVVVKYHDNCKMSLMDELESGVA